MITFITDRPNIKNNILFQLLGMLCIVLVLFICQNTFSQYQIFKNSNYVTIGIVALIVLLREVFTERVYEIFFDHDKQHICFSYKRSAFSKLLKYNLEYKIAQIEKSENTAMIKWFGQPLTIYFSKNKTDIFEISKKKDGFSNTALNKIYATCVQISITSTGFKQSADKIN